MFSEYGSEFWDLELATEKNNIFDGATWFISGRAALRAIIQDIKKTTKDIKIAIPSYLCESMIQPLTKEKVVISFYPVSIIDNIIHCDYSKIEDFNVVLVIDYFGFVSPPVSFNKDVIVIRDLTHSVFCKTYNDADYYFGSLRKWTGFSTGGFAFKKNGQISTPLGKNDVYILLREKAMANKKQYIENHSGDKTYLMFFHEAEKELDDCNILEASSIDIAKSLFLDVDFIKKRRRDNAKALINELKDYGVYKKIGKDDCPLCYPIICDKREELREYLIENNVFCPIHWPRPEQVPSGHSDQLYEKELSIICDQRYSADDMVKIAKLIKNYLEGKKDAKGDWY